MEHVPALRGSRRLRVLVALTAALSVTLAGLGFSLATPANAALAALTAPDLSLPATAGTELPAGLTFVPVDAVGTVAFSITAGALPGGVTLTASGSLTGTPTEAGSFPITVTAADDNATPGDIADDVTATAVATLTVNAAPALSPKALTIKGAVNSPLTLPDGFTGFTPTGLGANVLFTRPADLPADFSFDTATGSIGGTPTVASNGTYTVTAAGDLASATADVTIDVPVASITPTAQSVTATVGVTNPGIAFQAAGIAAPVFSIRPKDQPEGSPADLPPGIDLSPAGQLTVAPTLAALVRTYTVTAKDLVNTASTDVTITVNPAPLAPALQTVEAFVGTPITPTMAFAPSDLVAPVVYTVNPPLPSGLLLSEGTLLVPGTGVVSGTPKVATPMADYTVTATDANGITTTAVINLTVDKGQLEPPVITSAEPGSLPGSLQVRFTAPTNAPVGQVYAVEVSDAKTGQFVKSIRPFTSTTPIAGLMLGGSYQVVVVADGSINYLEARSAPATGTAALIGERITPPVITSLVSGSAAGSLNLTFTQSPNAPQGQTYSARVFTSDQSSLVRTAVRIKSPLVLTGLTPGSTYFVIVYADASAGYLESPSLGRSAVATASRSVTSTPAAAAAATASPSGTSAATRRPTAVSLGGGWTIASSTQAAGARRIVLTGAPSTSRSAAPIARVPANKVVSVRVKGLPKRSLVVAEVLLKGRWISMGSVRTTKTGRAVLPAFTSTKPGSFSVRLVTATQPVKYLTIKVTSVRGST